MASSMFDGKSSACKKVLLSLALATAGAAWSFDAEYSASQNVTISQAGSYLVTGTGGGAITIAVHFRLVLAAVTQIRAMGATVAP